MLPNFLVVGAQKAATTSLHNYLAIHPDIYLPAQKETKFFVDDERYMRGIDYYEREHFSGWKDESAVGEVDPDYMYFEQALGRLARHFDLSTMKFIFIFRNPIERAFSHFLMTYRRGLEPLPFEEAIDCEQERIAKGYREKMHYSYLSRGFYLRQVERFLNYTGRSQMLFLLTEDLKADPQGCLRAVFDFLGVFTDFVPKNIGYRFHGATVPRHMGLLHRILSEVPEKKLVRLLIPWKGLRHRLRKNLIALNQTSHHTITLNLATRHRLSEFFRPDNERLARFLDRDLSHWNYEIANHKVVA